jgi:hypothetical protein
MITGVSFKAESGAFVKGATQHPTEKQRLFVAAPSGYSQQRIKGWAGVLVFKLSANPKASPVVEEDD